MRITSVVAAAAIISGLLVAFFVAPAADATASCTATWVGPPLGNWAAAANWAPAGVPSATSEVCITTTSGPKVVSGHHAVAATLTATGTSMAINGSLTVQTFSFTDSDLTGTGVLSGTAATDGDFEGYSQLSGVQLSGSVSVQNPELALVIVTGKRTMCGAQLSVCLLGTTRLLLAGGLQFDTAVIGGTTTAAPAVTVATATIGGPQGASRIDVEASIAWLDDRHGTSTGSLALPKWDQLSADGVLSAAGEIFRAHLIVARTVLDLVGNMVIESRGGIDTPDGQDAYRNLARISSPGTAWVVLPSTMTPAGGTLTIDSAALGAELYVQSAPQATIAGDIVVDMTGQYGSLNLSGPGSTTTGDFTVTSGTVEVFPRSLTVSHLIQNGGYIGVLDPVTADSIAVHAGSLFVNGAALTAQDGLLVDGTGLLGTPITRKGTCTALNGPLTMAGGTLEELLTRSSCSPAFTATAAVTLPPTLVLNSAKVSLGATKVLVSSAAGVTGQFTTIQGQNYGPDHWAIAYSATQVVATLVRGNV